MRRVAQEKRVKQIAFNERATLISKANTYAGKTRDIQIMHSIIEIL